MFEVQTTGLVFPVSDCLLARKPRDLLETLVWEFRGWLSLNPTPSFSDGGSGCCIITQRTWMFPESLSVLLFLPWKAGEAVGCSAHSVCFPIIGMTKIHTSAYFSGKIVPSEHPLHLCLHSTKAEAATKHPELLTAIDGLTSRAYVLLACLLLPSGPWPK